MLRENNNLTEEQCSDLMKTLRVVWLDPVLKDVHDPNDHEFLILEERLRSVYQKLDSDFKQQAKGDKSLCSNLAYIYELVWIVFFCSGYNELPVLLSSLQLLHLIITAVYGKVWFASCIHILPKTTRK